MKIKAETRVTYRPWNARDCWKAPEARGEEQKRLALGASMEHHYRHSDFNFWIPGYETVDFCCFKPPSWCYFVTAAIANEWIM